MQTNPHSARRRADIDDPRWLRYEVGGGEIATHDGGLRFIVRDASARQYADAQIDDYQGLPRHRFPWRPPLTLDVRARFSHGAGELKGTAGFGFWNDPFAMTGRRMPGLPRALWFFYASPPSNMALATGVSGRGWKAAALDATRLSALLLAPTTPLAIPLLNIRPLYRRLWPLAERMLGISEVNLDRLADMTAWHDYRLVWEDKRARFYVDAQLVLDAQRPPRGPMGFVMWLDTQYAIVTPQGRFGWGTLDAPGEQWMEVADFSISAD